MSYLYGVICNALQIFHSAIHRQIRHCDLKMLTWYKRIWDLKQRWRADLPRSKYLSSVYDTTFSNIILNLNSLLCTPAAFLCSNNMLFVDQLKKKTLLIRVKASCWKGKLIIIDGCTFEALGEVEAKEEPIQFWGSSSFNRIRQKVAAPGPTPHGWESHLHCVYYVERGGAVHFLWLYLPLHK